MSLTELSAGRAKKKKKKKPTRVRFCFGTIWRESGTPSVLDDLWLRHATTQKKNGPSRPLWRQLNRSVRRAIGRHAQFVEPPTCPCATLPVKRRAESLSELPRRRLYLSLSIAYR